MVSADNGYTRNRHWRLLRSYVNKTVVNDAQNQLQKADVFDLFNFKLADPTPDEDEGTLLYHLSPRSIPDSCVILPLRGPANTVPVNHLVQLVGFDRTGVIKIWPSELLLAHHFLEQRDTDLQRPLRAVELAAGYHGIAAFALSQSDFGSQLEYLAVTDGNEECFAGLQKITEKRRGKSTAKPEPAFLRWSNTFDEVPQLPDRSWEHSFDLIFAADCFFMYETHGGLLRLIDALLSPRPGSRFVAYAPLRGPTLHAFIDLATDWVSSKSGLRISVMLPEAAFPNLCRPSEFDKEMHLPHIVTIERH